MIRNIVVLLITVVLLLLIFGCASNKYKKAIVGTNENGIVIVKEYEEGV